MGKKSRQKTRKARQQSGAFGKPTRATGSAMESSQISRAESIFGIQMSANWAGDEQYGLPSIVSRDWIVEHSDPDEWIGCVRIKPEYADDLWTHAEYSPQCACEDIDDCKCGDNPSVMWELESFSG